MPYDTLTQEIPDRLIVRVHERFGHDAAEVMLRYAKSIVDQEVSRLSFSVNGFIPSGRSLVSEVTMPNGETGICKVPVADATAVLESVMNEAVNRTGPQILANSNSFVVTEKLIGDHPKITYELIDYIVMTARRRKVSPKSMSLYEALMEAVRESRAREVRSPAISGSCAILQETMDEILELQHTVDTVQCHGDVSVENLIDTGERVYFIDPEPVLAPAEYDIAKMVTFRDALDIDQIKAGGETLGALVDERMRRFVNPLVHDRLSYHLTWTLAKFFLVMRGIYQQAQNEFQAEFKV